MIGDSLVEFFDWQKRFPYHDVINLGIAGETTEGLMERLPYIIERVSDPGMVLIMIGTNNVAMEDYGFVNTYRAIVEALSSEYSTAQIVITSLLPIKLQWFPDSAVPRMNDILKNIAKGNNAIYHDIYHLFLDDEVETNRDFFLEDDVHLSDRGYQCWADAVELLIRTR